MQGNCLLVGVGGSGKQSLARLAAYVAGCGVYEITLTRGYDETSFREDLKQLYTQLGAENKKMVFLFTDSHVANEGFLELINNMLTTGVWALRWHAPKGRTCKRVLCPSNLRSLSGRDFLKKPNKKDKHERIDVESVDSALTFVSLF
jgi:hypothetical protein